MCFIHVIKIRYEAIQGFIVVVEMWEWNHLSQFSSKLPKWKYISDSKRERRSETQTFPSIMADITLNENAVTILKSLYKCHSTLTWMQLLPLLALLQNCCPEDLVCQCFMSKHTLVPQLFLSPIMTSGCSCHNSTFMDENWWLCTLCGDHSLLCIRQSINISCLIKSMHR